MRYKNEFKKPLPVSMSVSIERAKQALSGAYSQSRTLVSNVDLYAV